MEERTDSYLAAETSLGPSSGFQGILFIWLSQKDRPVPHFPPSLTDRPQPPPWFHLFENCTRRNHPSAILYPNQVKWKLHEETYPSVIPQLSSGWNLLPCASCPPPLPGSLWGEVWVGREARISERGQLPWRLHQQKQQTYLLRSEGRHSQRSSRRPEERGCCGTGSNLASHQPPTALLHWTPRAGPKTGAHPERPRTHPFGLKEYILEGNPMSEETMDILL